MSSAKTCPPRYDAYTWEQVQQYNPNLKTNNIQKVQYVTNLKSLLTNRLTATDGVAKKSSDAKQAAANAAIITSSPLSFDSISVRCCLSRFRFPVKSYG